MGMNCRRYEEYVVCDEVCVRRALRVNNRHQSIGSRGPVTNPVQTHRKCPIDCDQYRPVHERAPNDNRTRAITFNTYDPIPVTRKELG